MYVTGIALDLVIVAVKFFISLIMPFTRSFVTLQSNSVQGASGGMSMGSTGPGKSYSISPQEPQGGGMKDLVGIVGSSLPSPRKKHAGPGPASLPVPMPGGPVRVGSGGHHVVLPGMPGRGRVPDDEYGVGVDRTMRPNGHAMEPLNKRIRCGPAVSSKVLVKIWLRCIGGSENEWFSL